MTALAFLIPFGGACLLAALSPFVSRRLVGVAIVAAGAGTVVCAVALARGWTVVWFGSWKPRDGVALGVGLAVDGLGAGLALFVAGLGVAALVLAARVIQVQSLVFDALMLVFIGAMVGFCLTGDLFNLFVFFELMSVSAYVLVGYEIHRRSALEGALTFAITNSIGSILLLFGIALVYGRTGALNLAQIGRSLPAGDTLVVVAFALIACGLLVKAAVVPFHLWTADAYAVAPTPVCVLLAGAFSELGLYALARVYWTSFAHVLPQAGHVLIGFGVLTGLVGAVMCAVQQHLKRMLAFATIAHVGLFLIGIGLLSADALAGVAVWVVADGLVKAGLFVCVSMVQHRYRTVDVGELYGRARSLRAAGVVFVAAALAIASLPPFGSFAGKALVEDAAPPWIPWVMLAVTGVVGGALLRAAGRIFWGLGPRPDPDPAGDEPTDEADRESEGGVLLLGVLAAVLTAAGMLAALIPHGAVGDAAAAFADQRAYAAAVLDGRPLHAVAAPAAPSPAAYAFGLASVALAVALALRPPPVPRAIEWLRGLHNGRPGDYVAWTVAGAAVLVVTLGLAS